jgi:hypothetical protein
MSSNAGMPDSVPSRTTFLSSGLSSRRLGHIPPPPRPPWQMSQFALRKTFRPIAFPSSSPLATVDDPTTIAATTAMQATAKSRPSFWAHCASRWPGNRFAVDSTGMRVTYCARSRLLIVGHVLRTCADDKNLCGSFTARAVIYWSSARPSNVRRRHERSTSGGRNPRNGGRDPRWSRVTIYEGWNSLRGAHRGMMWSAATYASTGHRHAIQIARSAAHAS